VAKVGLIFDDLAKYELKKELLIDIQFVAKVLLLIELG